MARPRSPVPEDAATALEDSLSLSIARTIAVTGFGRDTVYDLIRAGEVKSFTMGTRRFVLMASLRAYLERRAAEPTTIARGRNTRSAASRDGPEVEGRSRHLSRNPAMPKH